MTKISVLISSFGDRRFEMLGRNRALPSVIDQGFHEVLILHEPGMTLAEVRNANAARATGDLLCNLDADDQLAPGFADAMHKAIAGLGPGDHLLTPAIQYGAGKKFSTPRFWPEIDIKTGNWMVIGTLVPRSLFESVGGWVEYELYEDWAMWAKCIQKGASPVKVPEANYMAHVSAGSRNRGKPRKSYLYWRQRIGADLWPDLYLSPTEEENEICELATPLRYKD
jgi:hypothetical protein